MTIKPIIFDCRPGYLRGGQTPRSLLLAPVGTGTFLSYLLKRIAHVAVGSPIIATSFEPGAAYEHAVRDACPSAEVVVPVDGVNTLLGEYEPADLLLFVDPRCFPAGGFDPGLLLDEGTFVHGVRHLVGLETGTRGTKEYALLDADGTVRRIQRYYDGITWLRSCGVSCSLISVGSARLVEKTSFLTLSRLRGALSLIGVPTRDVLFSGGTIDLTEERGLLSLTEQVILSGTSNDLPSTYRAMAPDILVGEGCHIHATARLYGPVVIQDKVTIESQAVVIGPAVIGAGCQIQRNSTVAQCLLTQGTVIPANMRIRHRVISENPASADALTSDLSCRTMPLPFSAAAGSAGGRIASGVSSGVGHSRRSLYPLVKRAAEAVVALVGLIVLLPGLTLVAALIRLTSHGPALFTHDREGKTGKTFHCLKFRTMFKDAHEQQRALYAENKVDGPQFKLDDDPRVTPLGRWLRLTNIDELLQLVNVLLGQMSLIGPRPSPFRENQICVPWRQARLSVRPGITGLWQVCRHERSTGDFHQWIYYDTLYVRHMSLWLDLKILVATLVTLGGRWSVPLSWLIPEHKLHDRLTTSVPPMWLPMLHFAGPDRPSTGPQAETISHSA